MEKTLHAALAFAGLVSSEDEKLLPPPGESGLSRFRPHHLESHLLSPVDSVIAAMVFRVRQDKPSTFGEHAGRSTSQRMTLSTGDKRWLSK